MEDILSPEFPPELPPEILMGEPPEPPPKIREEIKEYVADWCKESRRYVRAKESLWRLLQSLYLNELGIDDWAEWPLNEVSTSQSRKELVIDADDTAEQLKDDYVHSPSYLVDAWVDNAYPMIFDGPEWLVVLPDETQILPDQPLPLVPPQNQQQQQQPIDEFSTADKLQQLLLHKLHQGRIHSRVYEALQTDALFGTVYAKVFWEEDENGNSYPVIQQIPLDRILPDWTALHNDVQRWRGIGFRSFRTYKECLARFKQGAYRYNEKEVRRRWKDGGSGEGVEEEGLFTDPDSEGRDQKDVSWLQVWEWHGKVPTKQGIFECVVTLLSDQGAEDPTDGVLVDLKLGALLPSGRRPFACAHFTGRPGPFGEGQLNRIRPLLYKISQFLGQLQDSVRLRANPGYLYEEGSAVARALADHNFKLAPGDMLPKDPGREGQIESRPLPDFPANEVFNTVQMLIQTLERQTSATDVYQGLSHTEKTATEAHILQQQASLPTATRVDLFCRNFLTPLADMALELIRTLSDGDQVLWVRDIRGGYKPLTITAEELSQGKYRVETTITRQDATRLIKAQSIERAFPTLMNVLPLLAQEGIQFSLSELLKRYIELLGIDGADRLFHRLTPEESMMLQLQQQMQQGWRQQGQSPSPPQGGSSPEGPPPVEEGGSGGEPPPSDFAALQQMIQQGAQPGGQI